jgi:hypothetical protein
MTNESSSDELRHQRPRNIDESRPLQIPGHSITKVSVRISVDYNILQLNQPLIDIDI